MKILILICLASALAFGQSSVSMGAVPFAAPVRGGIVFTLTAGGPSGACYLGNGFCWSAKADFTLHKVGTTGFCVATCDFHGTVGDVSTVPAAPGCSQLSFPLTNVALKIGRTTSGRSAWYSQTSCNSPSGFMGGGTLFVYQ